MSRYRPETLSKPEYKKALKRAAKDGKHLGAPREPTILETGYKFPCPMCAKRGLERSFAKPVLVFGGEVPGGYVLRCDGCPSLQLVSTNKTDAAPSDVGKFMLEAMQLATRSGWEKGNRLLKGLSGENGLIEMEASVRHLTSGDAMVDWDFWKSLAKGLGQQTGQVTITWNGVAAAYSYDKYLYYVLLDVTLRDWDEEQFWDALLRNRLEPWLAAKLDNKDAA